jgi:hypothetical protein
MGNFRVQAVRAKTAASEYQKTMNQQPELITIPASEPSPLTIARRDLLRAAENDAECHDKPSAMWLAQATAEVARLEAEEVARLKKGVDSVTV